MWIWAFFMCSLAASSLACQPIQQSDIMGDPRYEFPGYRNRVPYVKWRRASQSNEDFYQYPGLRLFSRKLESVLLVEGALIPYDSPGVRAGICAGGEYIAIAVGGRSGSLPGAELRARCTTLSVTSVEVFRDIVLPRMEEWPNLRILAVSAGGETNTEERVLDLSELSKVPDLEQLIVSEIDPNCSIRFDGLANARNLRAIRLEGKGIHKGIGSTIGAGVIESLCRVSGLRVVSICTNASPVMRERTPLSLVGLAHLGKLTQLQALGLRVSNLDDEIMSVVGELRGLEVLSIDGDTNIGLSARGFMELGKLKHLKFLDLPREPDDCDGIDKVISKLPELRYLCRSYQERKESDADLRAIGNLRHLEFLELGGRTLTDDGLAHLSQLKQLKVLNILLAPVKGHGLAALSTCKSLRWVAVGWSAEHSDGAKKLRRMLPDVRFYNEGPW